MSAPIFDLSHLTPEKRIALPEQLRDSLDPARIRLTPEVAAELCGRRAALEADGALGKAWREALDDLESGGA